MPDLSVASDDLVRYFLVPVRRWRVVAVVVLLGLASLFAYLAVDPRTYTSTTLIDLHQISTSPFDPTKAADQKIDTATEAKTATSQVVAARASALLPDHPSPTELQKHVQASAATGTTTLSMVFSASSGADSAAGSNAFARAYLESRSGWAGDRRQKLVDVIEDQLDQLTAQLTKVNATLATADSTSAAAADSRTTKSLLNLQRADLSQRRNALTTMSLDSGQIVSSAVPGQARAVPSRKLVLVGGGLIFFIIGLVVALARESLDRRIRTEAQVENLIEAGVVVTKYPSQGSRGPSVADDAMYMLRSRILAALPEDEPEALLVIDLSDRWSAGQAGTQLADLMARAGAPVHLIMIVDSEPPDWSRFEAILARSSAKPLWFRGSDQDDRTTLNRAVLAARSAGAIAVLVMVGTPLRSAIVANAALADDVILVVQAGHTTKEAVRRAAHDAHHSGANIFGGIMIRPRRALSWPRRSTRTAAPAVTAVPETAERPALADR